MQPANNRIKLRCEGQNDVMSKFEAEGRVAHVILEAFLLHSHYALDLQVLS